VVAEEHVRHRVPVLYPEKPRLHDGRYAVGQPGNGERASVHQQRDDGLARIRGPRGAGHHPRQRLLRARELDRRAAGGLGAHVLALADHQEDGLGLSRQALRFAEAAAVGRVHRRTPGVEHPRARHCAADAVEQGDHVLRLAGAGPAAERGAGVVGQRSDHGDGAQVLPERHRGGGPGGVVLEQDDRLSRQVPRGGAVLGGECHLPLARSVAVTVGVVEQAERLLGPQHSQHGRIDHGRGKRAGAHLGDQVEVRGARHLDVHPGPECPCRRLGPVSGDAMLEQLLHSGPIAHHQPAESPALAEHITQEPFAGVRRGAADLVERRHDRAGPCPHRRLERR
jgi:hypothetical protein